MSQAKSMIFEGISSDRRGDAKCSFETWVGQALGRPEKTYCAGPSL